MFREHTAALAVANTLHSFAERSRQRSRTVTVSLKQMKGDALCGLATNTRHATQGINHLNQQRRIGHAF
jgi:hypothetical protein